MHLECHNRTISGSNYVTLLSPISGIENTFFLSLYELPLYLGLTISGTYRLPVSPSQPSQNHVPRDTASQRPLPTGSISEPCSGAAREVS